MRPIPRACRHGAEGFTLVELVTVIAIVGLVAPATAGWIVRPMQGVQDVSRRAAMVDRAALSLARMERDVRAALPNSIRVSADGRHLELLAALDGGRYRTSAGVNPSGGVHDDPAARFEFPEDASWNSLSRLTHLAFSYGVPLAAGTRVAIHPAGSFVWSHAANGTSPGVITPAATQVTIADAGDEDRVVLSQPFRFAFQSPHRRFYLVEGPVTFRCDPAAGTLSLFAGYPISEAQPTDPALAPLASAARTGSLARGVRDCAFTFVPGSPTRSALVTLDLTLAEGDERVRLLSQIHLENAP
jgi:MSHA biogenesis protein MshO